MPSGPVVPSVGLTVLLLAPVAGCAGPQPAWVEGRAAPSPGRAAPVPSRAVSPAAASSAVRLPPAAGSALAAPTVSLPPASAATLTGPGGAVAGGSPDRFVAEVRRQLPGLALDRRDEELVELGDQACTAHRTGRPEALDGYGLSAGETRRLTGVARAALCPG
ncbi:hypothetical protein [Actinoplanes teichomyceticus]|uniref:hypothetical protein n=1 Tax=Actinoplanes teichomyceticus TaxID=1867 RepID=UPI00119EF7C7|nr:hypothetical protein [Actinoplanes teichomyceticus]